MITINLLSEHWYNIRWKILEGHDGGVNCIAILDDGRICSGNKNHTARVWNLSTGRSIILAGHSDCVNHICQLPNGRIVTASSDRTIRLWDISEEAHLIGVGFLETNINSLIALPDNQIAVSGAFGVQIFNIPENL